MPDEGTEAEGVWVLKKSTKDWASMVAEEMMTRREGRTRRILGRAGGMSERREWREQVSSLFENAEEEVGVSATLVRFVNHDDRVAVKR
jgi:putative heme degradation protein